MEIYNDLATVSPEAAATVFETVFYGVLENDEISDEIKADIVDKVYNAVMNDPAISDEAKMAIVEKVTDLLEENTGVELAVITDLRAALEAAGYLTAAEQVEIIDYVYAILQAETELEKARLADQIYTIILNDEDMTTEDRIAVLTIIYEVLDKHGYVDGALAIAFLKAYTAAKENGYFDAAIFGLGAAKDALGTAYDYVDGYKVPNKLKDVKALLLAELENTVATIEKLEELLAKDFLDPATWTELLALEGELTKHAAALQALALEIGAVIDP